MKKNRKINQSGITHILLLVVVVLGVAVFGTYMYMRSKADTVSGTYRIGTYNILGSTHPEDGQRIGGTVAARATRATNVIKGAAGPIAMDVVGVQEMGPDQYNLFNQKLTGYNKYPTTASQRTIYWRGDKFMLISTGRVAYPAYGAKGLTANAYAVWVRLMDRRTGIQFYVLNHHPVSWNNDAGSDKGGAQKRQRTAEIMRAWVQARQADNIPVFLTGDFNSTGNLRIYPKNYKVRLKDNALSSRAQLAYCILTKDNLMQNTYDMARGVRGQCPSTTLSRIDHIYATPAGVSVRYWAALNNASTQNASDHLPLVADVTITKTTAAKASASARTFVQTTDASTRGTVVESSASSGDDTSEDSTSDVDTFISQSMDTGDDVIPISQQVPAQ